MSVVINESFNAGAEIEPTLLDYYQCNIVCEFIFISFFLQNTTVVFGVMTFMSNMIGGATIFTIQKLFPKGRSGKSS